MRRWSSPSSMRCRSRQTPWPATSGLSRPRRASLAVLAALLPAVALAASARDEATRRDLRDAERLRNEQLTISQDAAAKAVRAAADQQRLAQDRAAAAARLQQSDAAIDAIA